MFRRNHRLLTSWVARSSSFFTPILYGEVDFANDCGTTGYFIGSSPVVWGTQLQLLASTFEVEQVVTFEAVKAYLPSNYRSLEPNTN